MKNDLLISQSNYENLKELHQRNPKGFWDQLAQHYINWDTPYKEVHTGSFTEANIKWFTEGKLNVCKNLLDDAIEVGHGEKIAFHYEYEEGESTSITYQQLLHKVSTLCHLFKNHGAKQGDKVILYMPHGIEVLSLMLACARMGLVHSVVFGGLSAQALKDRVVDSQAHFLLTGNGFQRGGKTVDLYKEVKNIDQDLKLTNPELKVLVHFHSAKETLDQQPYLDHLNYDAEVKKFEGQVIFPACPFDSESPLFILYTSGSTGKPKGLVHTMAGYLLWAHYTFRNIFNVAQEETYWCTADVGWITGHTYGLYGPLATRSTSVLYEGGPQCPDWGRFWQVVEKYQVNQFYTAPTAIRSFMAKGPDFPHKYNLSSLKVLGTVGEPIDSASYEWYKKTIGQNRCPIVDTWWQTETGGVMLTPLPQVHPNPKPGYATSALPGITPKIIDKNGHEVPPHTEGLLILDSPLPSMARTILNDHHRYKETYFGHGPYYFTGDSAFRDEQGNIRILGRMDDVINVSGHRIGTAEVEQALCQNENVLEAAVVGKNHSIKGQVPWAFVITKTDVSLDDKILLNHLQKQVSCVIGSFAKPEGITIVAELPKTRSGKIMRRLLKKLVKGEIDFGDTSTLAHANCMKDIHQHFVKSQAI